MKEFYWRALNLFESCLWTVPVGNRQYHIAQDAEQLGTFLIQSRSFSAHAHILFPDTWQIIHQWFSESTLLIGVPVPNTKSPVVKTCLFFVSVWISDSLPSVLCFFSSVLYNILIHLNATAPGYFHHFFFSSCGNNCLFLPQHNICYPCFSSMLSSATNLFLSCFCSISKSFSLPNYVLL